MNNLKKLTNDDYKYIWDKFYSDFQFRPSISEKDWPSIQTDRPNMKFSIKYLFGESYNELIYNDFIQKGIDSFVEITKPDEEIYALDWQHESFYIDPRFLTSIILCDNEPSIFPISFIPNGDYYIFITKDFENIWFGHPWEESITIIGDKLIKAFNRNRPLFLNN